MIISQSIYYLGGKWLWSPGLYNEKNRAMTLIISLIRVCCFTCTYRNLPTWIRPTSTIVVWCFLTAEIIRWLIYHWRIIVFWGMRCWDLWQVSKLYDVITCGNLDPPPPSLFCTDSAKVSIDCDIWLDWISLVVLLRLPKYVVARFVWVYHFIRCVIPVLPYFDSLPHSTC